MSVFMEVLMEKKAMPMPGPGDLAIAGAGGLAGHSGAKKAVNRLVAEGMSREEAERRVGGGALGGVGRSLGYAIGGGFAGGMLAPRSANALLGGVGLGTGLGIYRAYKAPQERAQEILDNRRIYQSRKKRQVKKASLSEEMGENMMDGGISRRGRQEAELRLRRAGLSNAEVDRAMREMPSTGSGVLKSMGYTLGGGAAGGLAGAGLGALAGKGGSAAGAALGGLGGLVGGSLLGSYKRYQTPIDRAEKLIAEKKKRR